MNRSIRKTVTFLLVMMLITSTIHATPANGQIVGDNAVVRNGAGFDGNVITTLSIGSAVRVVETENDWYRIKDDALGINGWIFRDLVTISDAAASSQVQKGRITASLLNVRTAPRLDATRLTQLREGQEISIVSSSNEWLQVILSDGQKGWIHGDYVNKKPNLPSAVVLNDNTTLRQKIALSVTTDSSLEKGTIVYIQKYQNGYYLVESDESETGWLSRDEVSLIINGNNPVTRSSIREAADSFVQTARSYLGTPYSYGTTGPSRFDCSGYVYYILHEYYGHLLQEHNISLPRSSRAMSAVGTPVSRNQLEVGDLVFFNNTSTGRINHVGFYIGNSRFIHASSGSQMSVIISSVNDANYNRRYATARRLFH